MDFIRSLLSSASVKDKDQDSTTTTTSVEDSQSSTNAKTSNETTTTTSTATVSTPVPRKRTSTSESISSCRSSSDEEELLLVRDQNDSINSDERYSQYEYNQLGRSGSESDGSFRENGEQETTTTATAETAETTDKKNTVSDSPTNAAETSSDSIAKTISGDDGYDGGDDEGETKTNNGKVRNKVSLKNFALIRILGKGAFAKVLEVEKEGSGSRYAMKVLKKHHVQRKNQVEHTRTERRVLATISHPFICQLRYAFQTKKKLYLILDFHPGGELFYHLSRRGRFREHQARVYAAEITLGKFIFFVKLTAT